MTAQTDVQGTRADLYDGATAESLARELGVPHVVLYDHVTSTLDVAHACAAEGVPSGTLILADMQTAGRGRSGHRWSSPARAGIWLTLLERHPDPEALDVLSLRIGLGAAHALDPFVPEPIRVKWPNDLYVDTKKLAGTLIEARWRDDRPEWVAIGVGVNLITPEDQPNATGLDTGTRRLDVLPSLVSELREAAMTRGVLSSTELEELNARDLARGKMCVEPVRGRVRGISPTGELLVDLADTTVAVRTGSLVLEPL